MFSNDIYAYARSVVCKVNIDCMTVESFHVSFAIWAVIDSGILFICAFFTIFASMIKLFLREIQHPATKISFNLLDKREDFVIICADQDLL